jgi:hypothetical protein
MGIERTADGILRLVLQIRKFYKIEFDGWDIGDVKAL